MAIQRNWNYYTYVSGDGTTYNIRAAVEWAAVAAHGLAAGVPANPRFMATGQKAPRKWRYRDATTGRTVQGPIGTSTAFDAGGLGDTQDFFVPGNVAAVTHALVKKVAEKIPTTIVGTQLADHT
jgi:hypothetical protein